MRNSHEARIHCLKWLFFSDLQKVRKKVVFSRSRKNFFCNAPSAPFFCHRNPEFRSSVPTHFYAPQISTLTNEHSAFIAIPFRTPHSPLRTRLLHSSLQKHAF